MAEQVTLRIITPDKIALDTTVSSVVLPGLDGSMGMLARHAPMVTALDSGDLTYRTATGDGHVFVSGGFAEVRDNTVRVVTQSGERADEIDEARAREAEQRARERVAAGTRPGGDPVDLLRAQGSLRRALMRQRVKKRG